MKNLETIYMGLKMRNPIIVSSSGLTNSVEKIKKAEENGAGAVVLKSLFEEQINFEAGDLLKYNDYPEAEDYIRGYSKHYSVQTYLDLIKEAKNTVNIPVIPSINCVSPNDWTDFAKKMEDAGADALELNVYLLTTDKHRSSKEQEDRYYELIQKVKNKVSIPVAVKIGYHFTNLLNIVETLKGISVEGVVLFNRFYEPDIDIDRMRFTVAEVFSSPDEIRHTIRWVGIVSDKVPQIDISASTGVHDGNAAIKLLLAGAQTVQVCSALYKNGYAHINKILADIETWMETKGFNDIAEFKATMNYSNIKEPAIYERAQFMKYFASIE